MAPPGPSMTATWHKDTYPAIHPTRPELQVTGKKVIVTGGGAGIGRAFAQSFAKAGAASLALIGRREAVLQETKKHLLARHDGLEVTTHVADISDAHAVQKAADEIGEWDILIQNAGVMSDMTTMAESDPDDWWRCFEVNIKGPFNVSRAFLPSKRPNAIIIGINAGIIQLPIEFAAGSSGYTTSKFGALKFYEFLAAENPDVHVVSMHPGIVESDMSDRFPQRPETDELALPSDFAVWLCSEEAKFLRGRFAWCNWDVEELKAKEDVIRDGGLLTGNCIGWPYQA